MASSRHHPALDTAALADLSQRLYALAGRLEDEVGHVLVQRWRLHEEVRALEACVRALVRMLECELEGAADGACPSRTAHSHPEAATAAAHELLRRLRALLEALGDLRRRLFAPPLVQRMSYATLAAALTVGSIVTTSPLRAEPADSGNASFAIIVSPGDTLVAISERYYGSPAYVRQIAEANGIRNPDLIHAGTTLVLPGYAPASQASPATADSIVVQPGDTLVAISQRYYGSPHYVREIANANGISNPSFIRAGTQLTLPAASQLADVPRASTAASLSAARLSSSVSGVATYYGIEDGFVGGTMACGEEFSPQDPSVVAVVPGRFPCGTRLLVTDRQSQRSTVVTVKDHCGGCAWNHIDLSRAAFANLGPIKQGRLDVTFTPLP